MNVILVLRGRFATVAEGAVLSGSLPNFNLKCMNLIVLRASPSPQQTTNMANYHATEQHEHEHAVEDLGSVFVGTWRNLAAQRTPNYPRSIVRMDPG